MCVKSGSAGTIGADRLDLLAIPACCEGGTQGQKRRREPRAGRGQEAPVPHALLLNASYEPLCVVSQRRAVVLILSDKAVTLEGSGDLLHAASWSMPAPSVIRLTRYIKVPNRRQVPLTRRAIFARDGGRCVYCDAPATSIDHVIPKSRGGA